MADKQKLITELRNRVADLEPLPDEPNFITAEDTLVRYLKSRDWNLAEAERQLIDTVQYRRRTQPLRVDCSWCHKRPGFHSMRQVGHDQAGRPVIYANFAQASTHRATADDTMSHAIYLIENAKRSMEPGVSTWVFVMDCTGMTLTSCNPKLGHAVMSAMSNHYPERLGLAICLNHSSVFHGVWKAIKTFLPPQTTAKVKFIRSKAKMAETFAVCFGAELSAWLLQEIALNKQKPLPTSQQEFWNPPPHSGVGAATAAVHDPRGCPAYVEQYLNHLHLSTLPVIPGCHMPHPNIVDNLRGQVVHACSLTPEELKEREHAQRAAEAEGGGGGASGQDGGDVAVESGDELDCLPGELDNMASPAVLPVSALS